MPDDARNWLSRRAMADVAIWFALAFSALAIYAQVRQFDFVNFDDDAYVYRNPVTRAGLTPQSIRRAFESEVVGNWVPVTQLSHSLAYQFFQMNSGMHHMTNVLLHILASGLLFASLRRATAARLPSALVAFLFALHPLHVESVAWVSERKDTLSAFWWFLALYAYVRYCEKPSLRRYLLVITPFVLGLMSKPMLVTFPFTLLLLDFWPLRRLQFPRIIHEKLPLIALSVAASAAAWFTQRSEGFVSDIPWNMRLGNSLVSYVTYIGQTFFPFGLAVFYPFPHSLAAWKVIAASTFLLAISALAIRARRTRPYLTVGWFWYLGTLAPVIGVIMVGQQAHADRYTYVPMVGLSVMLAWSAQEVIARWPRTNPAIAAAAVLSCSILLLLAWNQTRYWTNSETLYRHTIEVTGDNWLAEGNLGNYLMNLPERRADAISHLENALRIKPDYAEAENNFGLCLIRLELCGAAIPHFENALRIRPTLIQAHNNLGLCLARNGNYGAAIDHLETALRMRPDFPEAHFNLGLTLSQIAGREEDAIAQYESGLRGSIEPSSAESAEAHRNVGILLMKQGRRQEAIAHLEAARRIRPDTDLSELIDRARSGRE